jgi:FMN reductase
MTGSRTVRVAGISGSPSPVSKSRVLVETALAAFAGHGAETTLIDLAALPADALLGRGSAPEVAGALETVGRSHIVVVGTPVYRATYSGLLKVFFDLLPPDSLVGKVGVPLVSGQSRGHALALDHGLRPLFASLGATVIAGGVYATPEQFQDGVPGTELRQAVERAAREAERIGDMTK